MKPKTVTRDEWCAALRSGEYKQGFRTLKGDGRFCALGVLAHLSLPKWRVIDYGDGDVDVAWDGYGVYSADWSDEVWRWNDRQRLSLPEIADKIETTIPKGWTFTGRLEEEA